jgi:hypothetical protein
VSGRGYIKRGPMAADVFQKQFTQIHNAVFRDRRMSFKAKGIFGLISTHRDGFGVSEEAIASFSTDGLSAVRSGLRELIACKYLQRCRQRNNLGQLGEAEYLITDMPDGLVITFDPGFDPLGEDEAAGEKAPSDHAEDTDRSDEEEPSSEPTCGNRTQAAPEETPSSEPTCDFPTLADPTLGNHPHKKTTSNQKTISLSGAASEDGAEAVGEREEALKGKPSQADIDTVLDAYAASIGRPVINGTRRQLTEQITELIAVGMPAWWLADRAREIAARGWTDLAKHCERSTFPTQRKDPSGTVPWCEECDGPNTRMRYTADYTAQERCSACNPVALAAARRTAGDRP